MNLNLPTNLSDGAVPVVVRQLASVGLAVGPCRENELSSAGSGESFVIRIAGGKERGTNRNFDFNALLTSMLARFANASGAQIQRELEAAFRQVCKFLEIEHAGLWCRSVKDGEPAALTCLYPQLVNPPIPNPAGATSGASAVGTVSRWWGFPVEIGGDPNEHFPWISAEVREGRSVVFSNLVELPTEASRDREALRELGVQSAVVIPLQLNERVRGAAAFAHCRQERNWPEPMVGYLKMATQVLGNGVAREFGEERLRTALTEASELKIVLDAHALMAVTDAQGTIREVTDRFCEATKYSREELLGKTHRIINSGHHSKEFFGELWATIARGEVWRGEIKNRRKDGSCFWGLTTIVPFLNAQGKPREYVSIQFDITEQKLGEEALTKSYLEIKELKDRLQAETDYLKTEIKLVRSHGEIIGRSAAIKRVLHQVEQVAPVDCTVLITGETGTGKELIAREIHRLSARRERMMVMVNCAALPAPLVESELFGRERGAFTGALTTEAGRFELADGSTIFLDEIGELSLEIQAKFLRILQEGEFQRLGNPKMRKVNLRVIAATNRDLAKEVREGRFREDLYYRLRVFPIRVPALRERIEDLRLLVPAFVEEFSSRMNKQIHRIPRKAVEALESHPWPGNIRELRNILERGVILSSGEVLVLPSLTDLSETTMHPTSLADVEREHILKTLGDAGWRVKGPYGAAKRLQVKPSTLYSRMAKLGVHRAVPRLSAPSQ